MGYQVTARKWRPQTFDDVVEQRHVTRTLRNAIRLGRIAHAYLFAGTRGVGKTTMARVLAKALNCEQGPTEHPCNMCQSCLEITQGTSLDIVEIDGDTFEVEPSAEFLEPLAHVGLDRETGRIMVAEKVDVFRFLDPA